MSSIVRREVRVTAPRGIVSAVLTGPRRPAAAFVLGHGAGGTMHTPLVALVARGLADHGYATLRYNFPFADAGRRRPDFPRTLQATTVAAAGAIRDEVGDVPVVLGGKSLGGRMSSHVVADGSVAAAGLLLLSYPLHPPRRPDELRTAHLPRITCPILFVEGTRDPYARPDLLDSTLAGLGSAPVTVHVVDGGDHDLKVPASQRRPYADVVHEVVRSIAAWTVRTIS